MKMFAVLLALVSAPSFAAIVDGCFRTISYNGQEVIEGPEEERNLTKINSKKSAYYFDNSYQGLTTKVISIFKGFNEGWYAYANPLTFEELGETVETENEWSYLFEGEVYFTDIPYVYQKTDFRTKVHFEWRENGLLYGQISQISEALARDYQIDVVLEKTLCP